MFDEVTEYRRIVEPGIAEIAAVRHTSEQLDRLKIIACDQQRRLLVARTTAISTPDSTSPSPNARATNCS